MEDFSEKLLRALSTCRSFSPEDALEIIKGMDSRSKEKAIEDILACSDQDLSTIRANADALLRYLEASQYDDSALIGFCRSIALSAGTALSARKIIEKESKRMERENEEKLRRMERSYTAIFALFTVIVFALAGGLILSLAGMRASYAYGSIEDLRTALLIIGAFFLTVLSIIIKLLSTLVPSMKEKEKRTIPARILSAIKQPITIAMLFLILGLVSGDASIKDSSVSSSRMQSALSNVIPIAEDVIIDL